MKTRIAVIGIALVLATPVVSAASRVSGASVTGQSVPFWAGCLATNHLVRPSKIMVACSDGNFYVSALWWSRWTTKDALALGTSHQNLCTPDCARGRFATYPIQVRLYRQLGCRDGLQFTWLYYRYPRDKPPRVTRMGSWSRRGCH
jgi:hypothetical protein